MLSGWCLHKYVSLGRSECLISWCLSSSCIYLYYQLLDIVSHPMHDTRVGMVDVGNMLWALLYSNVNDRELPLATFLQVFVHTTTTHISTFLFPRLSLSSPWIFDPQRWKPWILRRMWWTDHRFAQVEDLQGMQACNLQNLPENYTMKYCMSLSAPQPFQPL